MTQLVEIKRQFECKDGPVKLHCIHRLSLFPQDGGRYTNREQNTVKDFTLQEEEG